LEDWLAAASVVPDRVLEFASYHAVVACVCAGAGIAVVPRSVLRAITLVGKLATYPLPSRISNARTMLVWRKGHRSSALDALRAELGRGKRPIAENRP